MIEIYTPSRSLIRSVADISKVVICFILTPPGENFDMKTQPLFDILLIMFEHKQVATASPQSNPKLRQPPEVGN